MVAVGIFRTLRVLVLLLGFAGFLPRFFCLLLFLSLLLGRLHRGLFFLLSTGNRNVCHRVLAAVCRTVCCKGEDSALVLNAVTAIKDGLDVQRGAERSV